MENSGWYRYIITKYFNSPYRHKQLSTDFFKPTTRQLISFDELRLISLLLVMSKILEKVIALQIKGHLQKYNTLQLRQSGYQQRYSCLSALLDLVDEILWNTDIGKVSALILLDYSKAFNIINLKLLVADTCWFFPNFSTTYSKLSVILQRMWVLPYGDYIAWSASKLLAGAYIVLYIYM